MARGYHRSFHLSPEPYMVGKRVVPRLWYINLGVWVFRFVLIIPSIALFFVLLGYISAIEPQTKLYGIIGGIGFVLIALLMNLIGFKLGRRIVLQCGMLTEAEASAFHHRMDRWPASWLEELSRDNQPHPLDDHGEPSDALESPNRAF